MSTPLPLPRLLLLSLACTLVGCFSYSTMHTAHTVDPGDSEVSVGAGILGGFNGVGGADKIDNTTIGHLGGRYGLGDRVDLGARLNGFGAVVDLNVALVDTSHFALSVDPEAGVSFKKPDAFQKSGALMTPTIANQATLGVGILADILRVGRSTVTLGAEPGYMFATGPNFIGTTGPYLEASLGWQLVVPVGRSNGLTPILSPTVDVRLPLDPVLMKLPSFGYSAIFGITTRI